ncbi:nitrous oxide reductase family maturation protein NosD [Trinickia caryophylli]|nr:nitrous oxide reductase family maturation protein NosD [Trinickia caryophylli]PMS11000.1 nitrous oxide reductase family maturation protein NosD [Trinickia caryophylli]TRX18889.1 nitrous oxide reductase family maturation protein NosD [Trinickia caryophylli]WQE10313.1 nitrous oxide reductase family maturation protein NosD [Trinickia caryophylli]
MKHRTVSIIWKALPDAWRGLLAAGLLALAAGPVFASPSAPAASAGAATDALAQAVARAAPGAVVTVPPGVHRTHLRIDKPLTLAGAPGAVLDGSGTGDVIRIAASDVTVRNLAITHSGTDLTAMNAGVFVEKAARRVTIERNVLSDILFGIYLNGAADVRVIGNRISGIAQLRSPDRGDGIHLWSDTGVEVRDNEIVGTRDGIYIYVSPRNRIVGNRMRDLRYGIHYMYSHENMIADNVTERTRAGYALMQSEGLTVTGNRSVGDVTYGMLLNYVVRSRFEGNTIVDVVGEKDATGRTLPGGDGKGMFVYNSQYNRIAGNDIVRSPIGIHVTAGSEGNRVYGNAFVDNRVQVQYVQNIAEEWSWQGRGNYWSDYVGWDMNGDGIGDAAFRPNDGVDILFWKYPNARLLLSSPAILTLRYVQRAFPVFTPPSVSDSHPLMKRPPGRIGEQHAARD